MAGLKVFNKWYATFMFQNFTYTITQLLTIYYHRVALVVPLRNTRELWNYYQDLLYHIKGFQLAGHY